MIPRPRPVSLALEAANGRTPDESVASALRALLVKRVVTPEMKPADVEAADARLIAEFYAALQAATDFDVAAAVFRVAAEAEGPGRDTLGFLVRLLRTRQPRPLYVETLTLQRLAALPARDWRPATIRRALDVARRGELAASRAASFAWVRPLLDAAARTRHEAEALLDARGFAPLDDADSRLRQAGTALEEVLAAEDGVEQAHRLTDEAFSLLPAFQPLVENTPALETSWFDAARETQEVVKVLALSAPRDPAEARDRRDALERKAASLGRRLDALRQPFAPDRITKLTAKGLPATPEAYGQIDALLKTPFPVAAHRADLWASLVAVDRRLNEETLRLDWRDRRTLRASPPAGEAELDQLKRQAFARLERRARAAAALLALASDAPDDGGPVARSRAWSSLPARIQAEADPVVSDRLRRLVSPLVASPRLDAPETNPTRLLRLREFDALRAWLAAHDAFEGRDPDGPASAFFTLAAEEFRRPGDPPTRADLLVTVETAGVVLNPAHPAATVRLRFRLPEPAAEAAARVDVVTADGDWLDVRRGSPWPAARSPFPAVESAPLAFDLAVSSTEPVEVPLEVRLRPEAEASTTPLPPVRAAGSGQRQQVATLVPAPRGRAGRRSAVRGRAGDHPRPRSRPALARRRDLPRRARGRG